MIAIRIEKIALERLVEQVKLGWLRRANERKDNLVLLGRYQESSSIWSEIKEVFFYLQGEKCAYCERRLESLEHGSVESDIEHYRPKGKVTIYPKPNDGFSYSFSTGNAANGYYWLAYDLENYALCCKTCNTGLKAEHFPIAGTRGTATQTSAELDRLELPLLLFPYRDDPADYIKFFGITPNSKHLSGRLHHRALLTIDFFRLASERSRKGLYSERSAVIRQLYLAFENTLKKHSPERLQLDQKLILALTSPQSEHTACARAYLQLLETNFEAAWKIYDAAVESKIRKSHPQGNS
jgi:hypothetical protein